MLGALHGQRLEQTGCAGQLIILEGNIGAGKTTLARQLAEKVGSSWVQEGWKGL